MTNLVRMIRFLRKSNIYSINYTTDSFHIYDEGDTQISVCNDKTQTD